MGKKIVIVREHLIYVIGELKRTRGRVTQKAVARRLHVGEYWFSHQLQDKEFREFYEAIVRDPTQPNR